MIFSGKEFVVLDGITPAVALTGCVDNGEAGSGRRGPQANLTRSGMAYAGIGDRTVRPLVTPDQGSGLHCMKECSPSEDLNGGFPYPMQGQLDIGAALRPNGDPIMAGSDEDAAGMPTSSVRF